MKVQIKGIIINTEDIFCIEPVESQYFWKGRRNVEDKIQKFTLTAMFTVRFFNNLEKRFILDGLLEFKTTDEAEDLKKVNEELLKLHKKAETARNVLVAYWSNNQSNIPKIEF